MNFYEVRNNLSRMMHPDPNGLLDEDYSLNDSTKVRTDFVNPSSFDMTEVRGIEMKWMDDKVLINPDNDPSFSIKYEDRTEGEIAAEVTKIIDYLS